jgi:hypothetical protein
MNDSHDCLQPQTCISASSSTGDIFAKSDHFLEKKQRAARKLPFPQLKQIQHLTP